ncbi:MAG: N-methyl-L-tryptophan oxidase [Armatimonadota bacterium]|nr:N-methyl-L-tryptophan oxidase [Armatimonadota bacterium]MDR5696479.1 N-methyl-L-tryptophan oxidase [Armatimonadota bacterium]
MPSRTFDAIVVGLGGVGSAAAYHLARRGLRVLGLERFAALHDRGSSHGHTRVIRQAYFEHPDYVPLLLRAYDLWAELERERGVELMLTCGGLMVGQPDSAVVAGSARSARLHALPHDLLSPKDVRSRFPAFHLGPEEVALYEPRAGVLFPEDCIRAHLDGASAYGAELQFEEPVTGWEADDVGVTVRTERAAYQAGALVVTAGPWIGRLLADLALPLEVERQVVFWFEPRIPELFAPERFPVFIWQVPEGTFYGIPALRGRGVKLARHHGGATTDPDDVAPPRASESEWVRGQIASRLPEADSRLQAMAACLYTNTLDEHFVIDRHPRHPTVVFASACSGHGFKFTCVTGQALTDLATEGRTDLPVGFLSLSRWAGPARG